MGGWLLGYGGTAATFLVLDFVWLSTMVPAVYRPALGEMLSERLNFPAAIAFYVIFTLAVMYLAVLPGVRAQSVFAAMAAGAVFGFAAYATYDLTNMATLKLWSLKVSLIDMAWGTIATAIAAGAGCWIMLRSV